MVCVGVHVRLLSHYIEAANMLLKAFIYFLCSSDLSLSHSHVIRPMHHFAILHRLECIHTRMSIISVPPSPQVNTI